MKLADFNAVRIWLLFCILFSSLAQCLAASDDSEDDSSEGMYLNVLLKKIKT